MKPSMYVVVPTQNGAVCAVALVVSVTALSWIYFATRYVAGSRSGFSSSLQPDTLLSI